MAISKIILNTITDDSEKAKPYGFEVANNNSVSIKNNSGNAEWIELTDGKMLYGTTSGITLVDTKDVAPFKKVNPSGYSKDLLVPSNNSDSSILIGHDYENDSTPFDNNSGNTYMTMIFDVDKKAFRVGEANTEFNDSNVGIQSYAIGNGNKAQGIGAVALGGNNDIQGDSSTVVGNGNTITEDSLTVIGNGNNTNGHTGMMLSNNVNLMTDNATIIGERSRYSDAFVSLESYSGVFTATAFLQNNGYTTIPLDAPNGITGIKIDTSVNGRAFFQAWVASIDVSGGTEYRIRRLTALFTWQAGDSSITLVTYTSNGITGSGSTAQARFNANGKIVEVQGDNDNDQRTWLVNGSFTIGYLS